MKRTYKVLIVDDEPIIRRGLSLTVPWQDHRMEVAGTACDGKEAIEKIEEMKIIDIIVTDVKMPNADGLELAAWISENRPDLSVIMISGYEEFSYARQALKSGVDDYLLKPVNIKELLETASGIIRKIEQSREKEKEERLANLANAIYMEVKGNGHPLHIQPGEDTRLFPFLTLLDSRTLAIEEWEEQDFTIAKEAWYQDMQDLLQTANMEAVSIFLDSHIMLTCILLDGSSQPKDLIGRLSSFPFRYSLYFILADESCTAEAIRTACSSLIRHIPFLPGSEKGIVAGKIARKLKKIETAGLTDSFLHSVIQGREDMKRETDVLFKRIAGLALPLNETAGLCRNLLQQLNSRFESVLPQDRSRSDSFQELFEEADISLYNSYAAIKRDFSAKLARISSLLNVQDSGKHDWLLKEAENYIQSNYNRQLSVQEAAEAIGFSPNYFSSVFKQAAGCSFSEYVHKLRVAKARELLTNTPHRVNEIASLTGYQEYKYFVEIFKKQTGMTPTEYRRLAANINQKETSYAYQND